MEWEIFSATTPLAAILLTIFLGTIVGLVILFLTFKLFLKISICLKYVYITGAFLGIVLWILITTILYIGMHYIPGLFLLLYLSFDVYPYTIVGFLISGLIVASFYKGQASR